MVEPGGIPPGLRMSSGKTADWFAPGAVFGELSEQGLPSHAFGIPAPEPWTAVDSGTRCGHAWSVRLQRPRPPRACPQRNGHVPASAGRPIRWSASVGPTFITRSRPTVAESAAEADKATYWHARRR